MTTFDRIKKVAKSRGWSLQTVAEKSGMSKNSLYHWKYDEPRSTSISKVAKTLDVSTDYLLGKTEDTKSKKTADIDDLSTVMRFEGKDIPEEDRETLLAIIRGLRKARGNQDDS